MTATPLAGRRVVVTRAEQQSEGLLRSLAAAGATVEPLPLLVVVPPADPGPLAAAAAQLDGFAWVVLTSANAVAALLPLVAPPWPAAVAVAAVGHATARALAERGVDPTLVAERSQAEGLLEALASRLERGTRVLLPQAEDARPVLAAGLRAIGVEATVVVAYRKALPPDAPRRLRAILAGGALGWVTFTSPSTVQRFVELLGDEWPARRSTLRAASIGPLTSDALRAAGVSPAAEATTPSDEALVAAIVAAGASAPTAR